MQNYQFDQFIFDPADGRLGRVDEAGDVHLRPQAGSLLLHLLEHPQTVLDRETLCHAVWGPDAVVDFESGLAALLREIRQALEKLGGDARLIETVPRRGYRLRAEVGRASENAPPNNKTPDNKSPGHAVWIVATLVILAAALVWWRSEPPPVPAARPYQLAILPLERFGDPDYPPAQAGILLADGVLAALWRGELEHLELIGRAGMRPYAGREDVVSAIAADLDVDLLIEGSIRADSGQWQVDLRLLAVPSGRVIWSQTVDGNDPALPVSDIAGTLVDRLRQDWPRLRESLDSG
ncbi:MAG: winged helix-turn-helix domain-containing protein [Wenzhouxiangellaceae bacterium]